MASGLDFFSFKRFFKRRSFKSSKKQSANSPTSPLSPQEKVGHHQSGSASRATKLATANSLYSVCVSIDSNACKYASQLKPSYSFDDVEKFLKMSCRSSKFKTPKSTDSSYSHVDLVNKQRSGPASPSNPPASQLCPLCLCVLAAEAMHSLASCGCTFCKSCLSQYLTINIRENNDVAFLSCPDANCSLVQGKESKLVNRSNLISSEEVKTFVDSNTFKLYQKFKLDWEVDNDPDRTWCPTPNCDNICVITKSTFTSVTSPSASSTSSTFTFTAKERRFPFYCHHCDQTFCSHCRKSWHPGFPCQSTSEDDNLMLALKRSGSNDTGEIKRCPRCSVWIERDEGCAQMMCRKCKHVFCWFCLQSLEDDFLLRHYDKGPCKNKLGHSRASVIWHRTQVVGIFAGFGILLLLASPLFLLAAPCILCCNCCCSSSCKYSNEDAEIEPGHPEMSLSSTSSFNDDLLFSSGRQKKKQR